MISIRKSWWTALALTAFVGCGDEAASTDKDKGATQPTPPVVTVPPKTTDAKPAPDKETKVDKAAKDDMPADDAKSEPVTLPKIEGPSIEAPAAKPDGKKADDKKTDDKKTDASKLDDEELSEVKKLPADEQILALKQLVCPVSDEHLGSMGTPIKVVAAGKTFFLCCKGCQKEVNNNAKDVVAKLKN